jgi:predicted phage-related endonuclease
LKGIDLQPDILLQHPQAPWMTANLDAAIVLETGERSIIEAKTGGICSPLAYELWTDDQYPEQYKIQVNHQLAVGGSEFKRAYLAALIPPKGFVIYIVERDAELIDALMNRLHDFWHNSILADTAPADSSPSADILKRLKRVPNKTVPIPVELIGLWEEAKQVAKNAEADAEAVKLAIIAALGDAEAGTFDGGTVTYFEQSRAGYTVQPTSFRTLRAKKEKRK